MMARKRGGGGGGGGGFDLPPGGTSSELAPHAAVPSPPSHIKAVLGTTQDKEFYGPMGAGEPEGIEVHMQGLEVWGGGPERSNAFCDSCPCHSLPLSLLQPTCTGGRGQAPQVAAAATLAASGSPRRLQGRRTPCTVPAVLSSSSSTNRSSTTTTTSSVCRRRRLGAAVWPSASWACSSSRAGARELAPSPGAAAGWRRQTKTWRPTKRRHQRRLARAPSRHRCTRWRRPCKRCEMPTRTCCSRSGRRRRSSSSSGRQRKHRATATERHFLASLAFPPLPSGTLQLHPSCCNASQLEN